jgi:hypothetical protein
MAMCFELVVNFGQNTEAAHAAALVNPKAFTLQAGKHRIPLHRAALNRNRGYIEMTVLPVGVGFRVGADGTMPRNTLSAAEFTDLGMGLYRLLSEFSGYVAAAVGWDMESLVDPEDLRENWDVELANGDIHGLVLSDALYREVGLGDGWAEFQPGYQWRPWRGVKPSGLTAG